MYYFFSALIHVLVALSLFLYVQKEKAKAVNTKVTLSNKKTIIPKNEKIEVSIVEAQKTIVPKSSSNKNKGNKPCHEYYGGIGIETIYSDGYEMVNYVSDGYPAQKAGMLAKDKIIYVSGGEIKGTIGTTVTIGILRSGVPMTFVIIRDKICYF